MTIAPERPARPAPQSPAGEVPPSPSPAVQHPPGRSPRPHYIAATIAAGALALDALAWWLLQPLTPRTAYALIMVAAIFGPLLVGAASFLNARPLPDRKG